MFVCFRASSYFRLTHINHYYYDTFTTYSEMQESVQAQKERYAALQRKLERLEKIHADGKKEV